MALQPGTRLGPYEITAKLGEGGMGEVWRATDTNLKRQVAIKVLPEAVAADRERLARFQREAEVLASLNHPNIAQIHGLEKSDGSTALVMELVEGPTLADQIAKGPIPVDEALNIAKQIADALEAAHEQGIIHRDLKPANVKVRDDGTVKVLDFGLAKALEPAGASGSASVSMSPTITTPAMTEMGMILGTAAYMSPEQAKGRSADKRSDIWAFGAVLYEMLTGRRAFQGDDVSDTMASVLKADTDWSAFPAAVPGTVVTVIKRCLQRDRSQRAHDIGDVRLALEGAFETGATTEGSTASVHIAGWGLARWLGPVALVGLLLGLSTGWAIWVAGRVEPPLPVRRFAIDLPASITFPAGSGERVAVSRDGQTIVYRGVEDGVSRLFQQRLAELTATAIPGTEGALQMSFFSPDGQWLAFYRDGALWRVALAGGTPTPIADLPGLPRGGHWVTEETIVVAFRAGGIARVAATGGDLESLTTPDEGLLHWYPQLLPGGRALLFTEADVNGPDSGNVMVRDLESDEQQRTLIVNGVAGRYTPSGHVVFIRGGDLWAARFDPGSLTVEGQPAIVEQGVRVEGGGAVQFAVADDGSLVYLRDIGSTGQSLVWFDRRGQQGPAIPDPDNYAEFSLSPDGTRVAVRVTDVTSGPAVWIYDLARGGRTRLTFESDEVGALFPTWTPDGTRVAFGVPLSWKRADGVGGVERLDDASLVPGAFTPDGTGLVFEQRAGGVSGIGFLTLDGDRNVTMLLDEAFDERNPTLSPDGRWLAYESDETGQPEVYVRPFPELDGRWTVSTDGGRWPFWNPQGGELFYLSQSGVSVVAYDTEPTFTPAGPIELFLYSHPIRGRRMAVSPDGERVLLSVSSDEVSESPLVVVQNWDQELKRLLPTE